MDITPYSLGNSLDWKLDKIKKKGKNPSLTSLLARELTWLETVCRRRVPPEGSRSPYSLGNSLDWKPEGLYPEILEEYSPYSLGNSLDWKLLVVEGFLLGQSSPYSLGNSLDWKLFNPRISSSIALCSLLARELTWLETRSWFRSGTHPWPPYSLGNSLDWKQQLRRGTDVCLAGLPTR